MVTYRTDFILYLIELLLATCMFANLFIERFISLFRDVYEKGMKAFVSFIQFYRKHECSLIFRSAGKKIPQTSAQKPLAFYNFVTGFKKAYMLLYAVQGWHSWLVRGLRCARSRVRFPVKSHSCFNFSPFCLALTICKYP